jgi:hypothetical protein
MNNKVKPALIGGVLLGLLSVIPFVSALNVCCCLWAILGGMLASYLYVKNSPTPVSAGDGAIVGALAGVIGAVISFILGLPINYAMGPTMRNLMLGLLENVDRQQAEMMRRQLEMAGESIAALIINGFILAVLLFFFSVIGGLIGAAIFEKRKGGPVPPPPPATGGPGGFAA